jgi:hypothetical protein
MCGVKLLDEEENYGIRRINTLSKSYRSVLMSCWCYSPAQPSRALYNRTQPRFFWEGGEVFVSYVVCEMVESLNCMLCAYTLLAPTYPEASKQAVHSQITLGIETNYIESSFCYRSIKERIVSLIHWKYLLPGSFNFVEKQHLPSVREPRLTFQVIACKVIFSYCSSDSSSECTLR